MGTRIPELGMAVRRTKKPTHKSRPPKPSLADALFPVTKQRVLGLLFGQPERSFGTLELIGLADSGRGAVQRELEMLVQAGLVEIEVVGLQKRYRASQTSPIFEELRRIVEKTSGVASVLRTALSPIADKLELAVLYGSVAKNESTSGSDIDLLLVSSELTLEDAYRTLEPAEARLGRRISPTMYEPAEFRGRRQSNQPFLAKVLAGPHVVLMGSLDGDRATR
jgi:predicted nucleotidyltransferase